MTTTLENQELTETPDQRHEIAETAHPATGPRLGRAVPIYVPCEPATQSSFGPGRHIDVGPYITPIVASFLAAASLGAVLVGAAGWADIGPFPFIAAGVLVVFAGLFARVRFGGGKLTPVAGLLLLPVLALFATAAPHLDDGVGDRSHHPTSFDDVESNYGSGIGNLDVDLRDVEFPPGEHVITIEQGIGAARVRLPADVASSASGEVGIGKLDLLGQSDDGFNTAIDAQTDAAGGATIILEFDTSIGYGSVESD